MIGRYVQENADGGAQRRRQIDLVGRDFEHVTAAGCERLQRQRGDADIAAHLRIAAGMIDQVRDQRRGGRFAVGAGNRNQRTVQPARRALAAEQFDVANDLDAFEMRALHAPVRRRMGQRHAGRKHKRGDTGPVEFAEVPRRNAGGFGLFDFRR